MLCLSVACFGVSFNDGILYVQIMFSSTVRLGSLSDYLLEKSYSLG